MIYKPSHFAPSVKPRRVWLELRVQWILYVDRYVKETRRLGATHGFCCVLVLPTHRQ